MSSLLRGLKFLKESGDGGEAPAAGDDKQRDKKRHRRHEPVTSESSFPQCLPLRLGAVMVWC